MDKPKTTDASKPTSRPKPHPNNIHLLPKTKGTLLILGEAINKPHDQYFGYFLETPKQNLNDIMQKIINHIYENIDIEWG